MFVVDRYGAELTAVITHTIERWDGKEAARRIELHVGRDLQFIRINGTIVGGLVGVLIHAVQLVLVVRTSPVAERSGGARRVESTTRTDRCGHGDDVAGDELAAAAGLHHVVDAHHPGRQQRLGRASGLDEVGQLEELAELDGLVADAYVGGQRALGHPLIIPVKPGRRNPSETAQRTSSRSTTKISVSPGLITPPAPRSPYPRCGGMTS